MSKRVKAWIASLIAKKPCDCRFNERDVLAFGCATIHLNHPEYPRPRCVKCGAQMPD